jgi:hypothetical protein
MEQLPSELRTNDIVHDVSVVRMLPTGRDTRVIRAFGRTKPDGNTLVIGWEVDKAREI